MERNKAAKGAFAPSVPLSDANSNKASDRQKFRAWNEKQKNAKKERRKRKLKLSPYSHTRCSRRPNPHFGSVLQVHSKFIRNFINNENK